MSPSVLTFCVGVLLVNAAIQTFILVIMWKWIDKAQIKFNDMNTRLVELEANSPNLTAMNARIATIERTLKDLGHTVAEDKDGWNDNFRKTFVGDFATRTTVWQRKDLLNMSIPPQNDTIDHDRHQVPQESREEVEVPVSSGVTYRSRSLSLPPPPARVDRK